MSFFTKKVGGASPLPAALTIVNVALLQQVKVTNYLRKFNCAWRKIGWFLRLMGFFAPHLSATIRDTGSRGSEDEGTKGRVDERKKGRNEYENWEM